MNGRILKIVTASTAGIGVSSVVHDQVDVAQALKTLAFALTGQDGLHPATPESVVIGEVVVSEDARIVIHHANPKHGGGWDYEFRGTFQELAPLHQAVTLFQQTIEQASIQARNEAALNWQVPAELTPARPEPTLEPLTPGV